MKNLSDVIDKDVIKKLDCSKLKSKVVGLELKIPNTSASIHINQYNADKQDLEKK